jgi:hypothetical protein
VLSIDFDSILKLCAIRDKDLFRAEVAIPNQLAALLFGG